MLTHNPNIVLDTSALMDDENIFDFAFEYDIWINIVTVEELDNLKTNKDPEVSFKARRAIHNIMDNAMEVHFDLKRTVDAGLISEIENKFNQNDDIIVSCAKRLGAFLCTKDYNLKVKAEAIGVPCIKNEAPNSFYTGFKEVRLDDEGLAEFYANQNWNHFDSYINEYLAIYDSNNNLVDVRKWNGDSYSEVYNKKLSTEFFGRDIKSKDVYQRMAFDSILTNPMTVISGKPGSGKSYLSIIGAVKLLEDNKYDRITVLFNPTKARGASDLGYYPGTQIEKAMQNSIGQMLISKFGDEGMVLNWINGGRLRLISMADARGIEITDKDILYITEAQNTSIDLMKLCLTRVADGCKVIVEGDYNSQVDNKFFENGNNGLKAVIEKFKGEDIFGYVELQNVHRGRIAAIADSL